MAGGAGSVPVKRTMPEAVQAADGADDHEYQLVQRACTVSARLLVERASEQPEGGEQADGGEQLQQEVRMLRKRLADSYACAERCRKGQESAQRMAAELQQQLKRQKKDETEERSARADKQELQVRSGLVSCGCGNCALSAEIARSLVLCCVPAEIARSCRCAQRKLRELEEQLRERMEELVDVHLQHRERTSTLERAVTNLQRQKADAEAQAQRHLEELRAAPGSADWQAQKEELEKDAANHLQRARNEESWRIKLAQELKDERKALAGWRQQYYEQKDAAELFGRQAAMLDLRPEDSHKLPNDKFAEVFAAVGAACERGRKEAERRKAAEEERQR